MRRKRLLEEDQAPVRKAKAHLKKRKREQIPLSLLANFALSEGLIRRFCELVERGLPPDGACDYLGILPSTFWSWLNRGQAYLSNLASLTEKQREELGLISPERLCALFVSELRKALAHYRLHLTDQLHDLESSSKNKEWIRWMAILERRDRANYSRKDPEGGQPDDYQPDEKFL